MQSVKIILIAGGSGTGKSTLAVSLCKKYPDKISLLHVDDYFKKKEEIPTLDGFANWDHPQSLRFDDIFKDLTSLKNGESVKILTKSELYNPGFDRNLKNKIEYTVLPKPIIILEGFLSLADERVRNISDHMIYLDLPIKESIKRRSGNKFDVDPEYFSKIILPMHRKFVEPSKKFANFVLDVSDLSSEEVFNKIEKII